MISYLPLLLVVITVPLYAASNATMSITYSMERGPSIQSICGRNVLLPVNGYNHELVSMGNAGGNCFATLVVGLVSKLTCSICVILDKLTLTDDVMSITFTGEAGKILLKYGKTNFSKTCFEGRRLDILVLEDEGYARKSTTVEGPDNVYSFKFALKPNCSEESIYNTTVPINTSPNNNILICSNTMEKVNMSFSVIILVGLLALGSYCIYKIKRNQQGSTKKELLIPLQKHGNQDAENQV